MDVTHITDPSRDLYQQYGELCRDAEQARQDGNMREYAKLSAEANEIWQSLEQVEIEQGHS